jgi:hypothetical protein
MVEADSNGQREQTAKRPHSFRISIVGGNGAAAKYRLRYRRTMPPRRKGRRRPTTSAADLRHGKATLSTVTNV